ncbi:MAG: PilZ domain-containing protein [Candidatus Thiodiazotropha sp. (ex Lucinoma annulata)]|nr:PilZ domain-containing protein [Candidatus Thiodiazotropha sp. (ex Lucinoma borealis)]MCU7841239.1 PilZ domain-containing protein [Candidatus Thiodiazotropha sp. (ex Troendleina suluensis)]MCU7870127.1 PilZ domain-containing protein [Candidatus Thiodiazotropha sp. (ex Lucinoma borealis)]MCU7885514.1 PilZ domain-containing protein [Candidatus Thiodiazotropha sp. (ex Lucinoma annulata)]
MDHRYGNRIAVQVVVKLYRNGHQLGEYKTRDISPSGVFLEAARLDLHPGSLVDLTFILTNKLNDRRRIKGMLIRHSSDGTGFMLESAFYEILPYLKNLSQDYQSVKNHHQGEGAWIHDMQSKKDSPLVSGRLFKYIELGGD